MTSPRNNVCCTRKTCAPCYSATLLYIVSFVVLLPMICLAGNATLPVRLDLGTGTSPVNDVYDRVTTNTLFDGAFGWAKQVYMEERDRGGNDVLIRDFVFSNQPATLRISVPDGDYVITLTCCDMTAAHPSFAVRVDGKNAYEVPDSDAGVSNRLELRGRATKGVMDIELFPVSDIWYLNAVTVVPLDDDKPFEGPRYLLSTARKWRPLTEHSLRNRPVQRFGVIKKPDYAAIEYPNLADYMRILERFPLFAERGWHENYSGFANVGYFGDGDHGEMGMRSMGNFIFSCALLASDPAYDPRPTGVSSAQLLDYARQCLRYMTRSHVTGDLTCADGAKWGDHWQSAWWTGKMAAGADLIWDKLTPDERSAVERVVVHEANRHLERVAPGGATSNTRSEENAWDTEVLAAALALFPTHENAPKWWRKLQDFSMNTLSAPQDKQDSTLIDHRPVKSWVYTENIHSDFTIENHGSYHFCYMACPLHSLAWDWYNLTSNDQPVPQALFHHYTDVYDVIRRTFLYEGRFAYIAGKDWPRYAYGLSFVMPALVMMQEVYGDRDARLFERKRVTLLEREQIANADGSFYGHRFTGNRMLSRPLEYETDTYANLGACYLMHKKSTQGLLQPSDPEEYQRRVAGVLVGKDSSWIVGRSSKVFTSFSWRELGGPYQIGLFVPKGCDDMVEWGHEQLSGSFAITGNDPKKRQVVHNDRTFDGGFWTVGRVTSANKDGKPLLNQELAFISIPEDGIALLMDHALAASDITVSAQEGLKFYLANDIFNGGVRRVTSPKDTITLWGGDNTVKTQADKASHVIGEQWINVDGKLSFTALTANSPFTVKDLRGRSAPWGSIEYEMIYLPCITQPHDFHTGGLVRYSVVILAAGDTRQASLLSKHSRLISSGNPRVRSAILSSDGRREWLVSVNFGDQNEQVAVQIGKVTTDFEIKPMSADVRRLD